MPNFSKDMTPKLGHVQRLKQSKKQSNKAQRKTAKKKNKQKKKNQIWSENRPWTQPLRYYVICFCWTFWKLCRLLLWSFKSRLVFLCALYVLSLLIFLKNLDKIIVSRFQFPFKSTINVLFIKVSTINGVILLGCQDFRVFPFACFPHAWLIVCARSTIV